jgi:hypothetical protein
MRLSLPEGPGLQLIRTAQEAGVFVGAPEKSVPTTLIVSPGRTVSPEYATVQDVAGVRPRDPPIAVPPLLP